jgi:HK97 gp10 family phage protein
MQLSMSIDSGRLLRAFSAVPSLVSRELRGALQVGLKDIQLDAGANLGVNDNSQHIARSIKQEVSPSGLEGQVYIDSGVCPYAVFQHEGTGKYGGGNGAYPIKPKTRKRLYWVSDGEKNFSKGVIHPGVKPQKFLTKAFTRNRPIIIARLKNSINRAFQLAGV